MASACCLRRLHAVASRAVDLLADKDLQVRSFYCFTTEGAKYSGLLIVLGNRLGRLSNSFPQLGRQELSIALAAFFFELETDLLAIDFLAYGAGAAISFKGALAET